MTDMTDNEKNAPDDQDDQDAPDSQDDQDDPGNKKLFGMIDAHMDQVLFGSKKRIRDGLIEQNVDVRLANAIASTVSTEIASIMMLYVSSKLGLEKTDMDILLNVMDQYERRQT